MADNTRIKPDQPITRGAVIRSGDLEVGFAQEALADDMPSAEVSGDVDVR